MATLGEQIIQGLEAYGVDTVFGIPGVHTVELYRGLAASRIHHVTPRHEQGAGFMADGYARASGRPGVAFVITGPGLTNILTPMAQAYADSIPMLVISSVNRTEALGMGAGDLHEIRNQSLIAAQVQRFRTRSRIRVNCRRCWRGRGPCSRARGRDRRTFRSRSICSQGMSRISRSVARHLSRRLRPGPKLPHERWPSSRRRNAR